MLSKDRCKNTSGFFVIPLLSQLWEEKNYCEKRNELCSWRPVALPNRHIHLCLFKQGYDVHALLSSVMHILSGENITAVYTMSRCRWDQNTTQVANRLDRARGIYVWLLHLTPCGRHIQCSQLSLHHHSDGCIIRTSIWNIFKIIQKIMKKYDQEILCLHIKN